MSYCIKVNRMKNRNDYEFCDSRLYFTNLDLSDAKFRYADALELGARYVFSKDPILNPSLILEHTVETEQQRLLIYAISI